MTSMFSPEVVTFGEAMSLFVATQPGNLADVENFTRRMAGAETNVAVGLARLGFSVGWVGRLGNDSFGRFVRATLAREGVDTARVATDETRSTGFMLKSMATDGTDPQIEYHRRNSAGSRLSLADWSDDYFLPARHMHVTGIAPALSGDSYDLATAAMQSMRKAGRSVSFDPNLRPALWPSREAMVERINALAVRASWVLPGVSEGLILTGRDQPEAIADFYLERGVELVVVKLGPNGAYWKTASGSGYVDAAPVAKVVDTVGAGDGFAVGVISGLLEGDDVPAAVWRGNRVGACAIQVIGDMDGLPQRPALGLAPRPPRPSSD